MKKIFVRSISILMPLIMVAMVAGGFIQILPVVFAETAANFTVTNNGAQTAKGGASVVAMELDLPNPATDTSVAGLTTAGTLGTATFPAGWSMYGYDAVGGGAFNVVADWIGTDDDGDGNYTSQADAAADCDGSASTAIGACTVLSAGAALLPLAGTEDLCTDSLTAPTVIYVDGDGNCISGSGGSDTTLRDDGGGIASATTSVSTFWSFVDDFIVDGTWNDTEDLIYNSADVNGIPQTTWSAAADTTIAGVPPAHDTIVANMNSAKPAGWTVLLINDGGAVGTWEAGFDMIFNDDDGTGFYNADNLISILFGNPGTCNNADIASFTVYEDTDGSGTYNGGDIQIANNIVSPFIGTAMPATGSVYTTGANEQKVFLVVTFAGSPANGCTFTAKLPNTAGAPYAAQFASGDDGPTDSDVDTTDTITIDSVSPSFAVTTATVDSDNDGTVDQITVRFDENVNIIDTGAGTDGISSLAVSNGCATIANGDYSVSNGSTVTLNVSGCTANDTSITPTVTYAAVGNCSTNGAICDIAGNQLADTANQAAADGAPPIILSREYFSSSANGTVDRLYLTFSENAIWNGNNLDQFAIINQGLTGYDDDGTPEALMGGSGSVNFGISTTGTTDLTGVSGGTEPTVQYTQSGTVSSRIQDAAGNYTPSDSGAVSIDDKATPYRIGSIEYDDGDNNGQVDVVNIGYTEKVSYTYQDSDWSAVENNLTNFDVTACTACTNVTALQLTATADAGLTGVSGGTEPTLAYAAGNNIADANFNVAADFVATTLADTAPPVPAIIYYRDTDYDGRVDQVEIQFTEPIITNTAVLGDFTYFDNDITNSDIVGGTYNAETSTYIVTIDMTALGDADITSHTTAPTLAYTDGGATEISDAAGNQVVTFGATNLTDGAAPYIAANYYSDINFDGRVDALAIQFTEPIATNTAVLGDFAYVANDITHSDITGGTYNAETATTITISLGIPGDADITSHTVPPTLAYTDNAARAIADAAGNQVPSLPPLNMGDGAAPVLVGVNPVYAVQQDGSATNSTTNIWYYYTGQNLRFRVEASEPLSEARACVRSLTQDDNTDTCDAGEFAGVLSTDYITHSTNPSGDIYEFNTGLAALAGLPSTVDGFPMNIALQDSAGNWGYGGGGAEAYTGVFNVVLTTIDATLGGSTTDLSTIADYTAATNIVFEKAGNIGKLEFAGPINLTAPATITALQSLSTNVITGGNDGSGAAVLGINSANLAAFDTTATLTAVVPTANRPGLIVYDNSGTQIDVVPNNQSSSITLTNGDTLNSFSWNSGTSEITWITDGFSSFGTDNTGPTVTDGNISIAGATGTGGAYKIGDTVTVTWDNSAATGDNNGTDFSSATADFSAFGGGTAVGMSDTTACGGTANDDIYEACYTIVAGTIDGTNLNAVVTAYDAVGNATTTADTTNATVDNIAPTIGTPGSLSLTLDNNTNSVANISDTVTYNNAVPGAADGDTFTVNLTALTGTAAATNAGSPYTVILGTLTGTQTFTETVTDNAGNTITGSTSGLAVDNRSLLTSTSVALSNTETSQSSTYTIAFTTNSTWPADGKIKITFPTGFNVAALDTTTATNLSNVDGVLTVTNVTGQVVTVARDGSGAVVLASTAVSFRLGSGTNPGTAGTTGTFTFLTTTVGDVSIDINDAVSGVTLTSPTPPAPPASGGGGGGGPGYIPYTALSTATAIATATATATPVDSVPFALSSSDGNVSVLSDRTSESAETLPAPRLSRTAERIAVSFGGERAGTGFPATLSVKVGKDVDPNKLVIVKDGKEMRNFSVVDGVLTFKTNDVSDFIIRTTPEPFMVESFPDIAGDPELNAIQELRKRGVVEGNPSPDGKRIFKPAADQNRAETAAFVVRAFNLKAAELKQGEQWFKPNIEYLENIDVLKKGLVEPDAKENKVNFIAFLVKMLGYDIDNLPAGKTYFDDVTNSDVWYYNLVSFAVDLGIINETGGNFNPGDALSRSMGAGFTYRAIQN